MEAGRTRESENIITILLSKFRKYHDDQHVKLNKESSSLARMGQEIFPASEAVTLGLSTALIRQSILL